MSTILQQLQDVGSSITGAIHKAVLCVPRVNFADEGKGLNKGIKSELTQREDNASKEASAAAAKLQDSINNFTQSTDSFRSLRQSVGSGYCMMQVQYNPKSISFTKSGSVVKDGGIGDAGTNDNVQIMGESTTTMRVTLLFDAVNITDAFGLESFNLSADSLLSEAIAFKKSDTYDVSKQVNALLALTIHGAVRYVVFQWSNLTFAGELTSVTANYTMFNASGSPICAEVTLSISQKK